MILSNLLLSAWILNTHKAEDQKLYMTTLHLKLNAKKPKHKADFLEWKSDLNQIENKEIKTNQNI